MGSPIDTLLSIQIRVIKAQAEAQIKSLQGDIRSLQSQMRASSGGAGFLDQTSRSALGLSTSLRSAGYALLTTFTGPVLSAGKSLLDSFMANQTAAANLAKVYGTDPLANYSNALTQLQGAFKALSSEFGVAQSDVTNIGAAWAAAGVQGTALAQSVKNTLTVMTIGDLDSATATQALIAIQAAYGASSEDLTGIINTLNVVENQTGVDMGGLIQALARAGGVAATAGIDVRHLAAMVAALSPAAGSAATAGNGLKTIIQRLLVPTQQASDLLAEMGVNTNSLAWNNQNGTQRLEAMATAFGKLTQQQKAQVSAQVAGLYQVNRFDVLMQSMADYLNGTGDALSYYGVALQNTGDPIHNAKVASNELQIALSSQPKMLAEIGNALKNQLMDTIKPLIPVILSMADALLQFAQWFGRLNPAIQKFVGIAILVLAVLGPVLLYVSALQSMFRYLGAAIGLVLKPFAFFFGLFGGGASGEIDSVNASIAKLDASMGGLQKAVTESTTKVKADIASIGPVADATAVDMQAAAASTTAAEVESAARIFEMADEITATLEANSSDIQAVWAGMMANLNVSTMRGARDLQAIWDASLGEMVVSTESAMQGITAAVDAGMLEVSGGIMAGARDMQAIWDAALLQQEMDTLESQSAVTAVFEGAMLADLDEIMAGSRNLQVIWGTSMADIVAETEVAMAATTATVGAGMVETAGAAELGGAAASSGLLGGLMKLPMMLGRFMIGPWGLAIAAVVGVLLLFPDQVKAVFNKVVSIVSSAAKQVYQWFQYINPFAHHSPSLVENVTQGMAIVSAAFASVTDIGAPMLQAYNDVKNFGEAVQGLAATSRNIDFSKGLKDLTDAGATQGAIALYKELYADLDQLEGKASDLNDVIQQQQIVVDADKAALDGANAALNAQQVILNNLTKTQSYWSDLITKTKNDISDLSSTGIVGQRAMSDSIFANTQAQKALQLQMMQMEDANGPINDVSANLAALQGQIETLTGEQTNLRNAGAGSEIMGPINQQLAGLQAQQVATQTQASAYDDLSKQLDKLQRQGQELDLENSLDFDGLTRQIDQASTALNELPFDEIMRRMAADNGALATYTDGYNRATDAVTAQQTVVDGLTAQRDALQATYDTENAKLQSLQDAYGKVNDAIQAVNSSLQTMSDNASKASDAASAAAGGLDQGQFDTGNMGGSLSSSDSLAGLDDITNEANKKAGDIFGKFDMLGPIKNAWKKVVDWSKTNLGGNSEVGQDVMGFVSDTTTKLKSIDWSGLWSTFTNTPFVKTLEDMTRSLGTMGGSLKSLMAPELITFFKELWAGFQEYWEKVSPKIMPLLSALGKIFADLWILLKPLVELTAVQFLAALKIIASTINGFLKPALSLMANLVSDALQTLTDFLNFVDDLFHGRWGKLWGDVTKIFNDWAKEIIDVITGVWDTIWGTVEGFVNGVIHFFEWLYDELVGHSIIPDMMDSIVNFFLGLPGRIFSAISTLVTDIVTFFLNVATGALTGIVNGWIAVNDWFIALPGVLAGYFVTALTWLAQAGMDVLTGIWNGLQLEWQVISTWFTTLSTLFAGWFVDAVNWLGNAGSNVINGLWNGIKNVWNREVGAWQNIGSTIKGWFLSADQWLINAGSDIISGLFNGIRNAGSNVAGFVSDIAGKLKDGINNVLNLPIKVPSFDTHIPGVGSIGGFTLIPRLAMGGIFDKATQAIIGESGREAVIPLTNGKRAWELVKASGLLDIIGPYMTDSILGSNNSKSLPAASGNLASTQSNNEGANLNYTEHNEAHTYNFYGDMKFPNVTSGHDVEDFLKNLETLARG